jgi:hypothetical protein
MNKNGFPLASNL